MTRPSANPPQVPLDAPERKRLPLLLRRSWYGLNQSFRRRIAHTGVTPDQFTVLRTLHESGANGLSQRELTEIITSDPNTVASLLERMEKAGWISREPNEKDRRALCIRLLAAGRKKYMVVRELAVGLQAEILSVLPEAEREPFLANLEAVSEACRAAAENAPRSAAP